MSRDGARAPVLLEPRFQRYAWGDSTFIPELFGFAPTGQPYAEAWLGAHPSLPAFAHQEGCKLPLDQLIAEHADFLGPDVYSRFHVLPYLFKILAAAHPLSIQIHPSRAQAIAGFRRENSEGISLAAPTRNYRDPNPKPELILALTRFDALCGFRTIGEIDGTLRALPEISTLLPDWKQGSEPLRNLLENYFTLSDELILPALERWVTRLRRADAEGSLGEIERWVLRADAIFTVDGRPDRGLFLMMLLNLIQLDPGEALFLPAGLPHGYLQGAGIEVMSSSDNVIRAGLTPKRVDRGELLRLIRYQGCRPPTIKAVEARDGELIYPTSADEFALSCFELRDGASLSQRLTEGPELLFFYSREAEASVRVSSAQGAVELTPAGSCLLPHRISFELRARASGTVFRVRVPQARSATHFRDKLVRRLTFGTSGLRGLVTDLSDLEAYVNTRGFLDYLLEVDGVHPGDSIIIAGDLRPSTDSPERSILRAVARAVVDSGFRVVHAGKIPTPALANYGFQKNCPSIMVTGSHIPFDRNGIKFYKRTGEVLKTDEKPILAAVEAVRREEYGRPRDQSLFDDEGMFYPAAYLSLPAPVSDAADTYIARYLDFFGPGALHGARVAVYEHSAVGAKILGHILRHLGAIVHPVGASSEFVPIDTEAVTTEQLDALQTLADETIGRVGRLDAIVSTDGDSDRPMILGVDSTGRIKFFAGDLIGIVVADYLQAELIGVPIAATDAIETYFAERDVEIIRTRIGSPWVIAAVSAAHGARRVGWEANGGFLTFSEIERGARILPPLPTRDAVLPILAVLHIASQRPVGIDRVFRDLPLRFGQAGLVDGISDEARNKLISSYSIAEAPLVAAIFSDDVIHWIGADGTVVEATSAISDRLRQIRDYVAHYFTKECGFGRVVRIDLLDGLRVTFENRDVVHVRPSGNAPQLRAYALSSSEQRARAIIELAVGSPSGILQEMIADASR